MVKWSGGPPCAGALGVMKVMWFGGHLGFHSHSIVAITCSCLPIVHSNMHGLVVPHAQVHWAPCRSCSLVDILDYVEHNGGHDSLMLAHSVFKLAWLSGLVVPLVQVHWVPCRLHGLAAILDSVGTQWWPVTRLHLTAMHSN